MPCLCGCRGGAVNLAISIFTQFHWLGFNVEFETLYELILQVVADLWQRKCKVSGCFKNSTSFVLQQFQNKVSFQRNGSSVVLKFLLKSFKGIAVLSIHTRALSTV